MSDLKPNSRLEEVLKSTPEALKSHYIDLISGKGDEPEALPDFHTLSTLKEQMANEPKMLVNSTGWTDLDRVTANGIAEGEVVMLAAEAGAGKTHFAVNIAINYAKQGKSVCYLTLEDGWKMVVDRFGSMDTDMVCHDNVFMVHEDELTMQNASAVIKRASEDASLIIVDNLFALPLRQNAKGDYWQSQAEWVDDICNIIRSTRSSALILHHLNKTPNGTIPGRFQIAGSTRLINRVAQAWLLCRNDSEPETIAIKVEKNRRSMYKGECFLKSASHGKLYGIDEKHVNPKLVSYAKDVFKVDR